MEPTCPVCHVTVRPTDYYCYNCGKNLHEKPPEISQITEYLYYAASLLLPPLGLYWGFRYIKLVDDRAKKVGWICIVLTLVSTVIVTILTARLFANINAQVNQQLQGLQGL